MLLSINRINNLKTSQGCIENTSVIIFKLYNPINDNFRKDISTLEGIRILQYWSSIEKQFLITSFLRYWHWKQPPSPFFYFLFFPRGMPLLVSLSSPVTFIITDIPFLSAHLGLIHLHSPHSNRTQVPCPLLVLFVARVIPRFPMDHQHKGLQKGFGLSRAVLRKSVKASDVLEALWLK